MSRVLVAEDEESLLDIVSSVVAALGHEVVQARDGDEALELARAAQPDLVVSDFMMPHRTGLDLLREVRADAALASVPFILISSARPPGANEATAFLAKPISLDEFEAAVASALRESDGARSRGTAAPARSRDADPSPAEEMLHWVVHELKTPLSAIQLNAEVALQRADVARDADARHRAEVVLRQARRMRGRIDALLDAAALADRRVVLRRERVDLAAWVRDLGVEWRERAPSVAWSVTVPTRPLFAEVDLERLRQVVDNLLSNAVKYGGDAREVRVELGTSPGRAVLQVIDRGPGIPAAELPHLFERFRRADGARGGGHGLGLYIASELARLHGGVLRARSAPGEGSTFTLTVPLGG